MKTSHDNPTEVVAEEIVRRALAAQTTDRRQLFDLSRQTCSELKCDQPPVHELLAVYRRLTAAEPELASPTLERLLYKTRVRSLSGVAVVTVLTKPFPCPGRCIYCPTEDRMPKSYLSNEPAAMRALDHDFDPIRQVTARLRALAANGHPTDKIELIVKGGTWSSYPWNYRRDFIRDCFTAANEFGRRRSTDRPDLKKAQCRNETAAARIVGLTLETRPDSINPTEITRLRELGCTRIELGVQALDDRILETCHRGHDVAAVARATIQLKNAGFKVDYHLMPQLPGVTPSTDLKILRRTFDDPRFRPDMIKIYPCTVLESAELHDWWRDGRYAPYSTEDLLENLIAFKQEVPEYCRISRIIRDIPTPSVVAGNRITSLRQNVAAKMKNRGLTCRCLRCREVGRIAQDDPNILTVPTELFSQRYESADGQEHFLTFEDTQRRTVFAFCRLRLPNPKDKDHQTSILKPAGLRRDEVYPAARLPARQGLSDEARRTENVCRARSEGSRMQFDRPESCLPEIKNAALLRELHTYGHLVPIADRDKNSAQHRGYGRRLMAEAERLATEAGFKKMAVISGVGVRGYYRRLGYRRQGTYMVKRLDRS